MPPRYRYRSGFVRAMGAVGAVGAVFFLVAVRVGNRRAESLFKGGARYHPFG